MSNKTIATLNTGNFSITVAGVVKDDKVAGYVKQGLVYDLQRGPATKAYLGIAGIPGKKAGVLVFPDKFERESVPFSPENAEKFKALITKEFADKLDELQVAVTLHEKEETGDGRNKARALVAQWKAAGKLDVKLGVLDYEGDKADDAAIVEHVHEWLVKP